MLLQIEVIVDETAGAARQKELHTPLLMAPGPGGDQRAISLFADHADFRGLSGLRQPGFLRNAQGQVQGLVFVPRIAVVVAEEIDAVVRRDLPPLINRMNFHFFLLEYCVDNSYKYFEKNYADSRIVKRHGTETKRAW